MDMLYLLDSSGQLGMDPIEVVFQLGQWQLVSAIQRA